MNKKNGFTLIEILIVVMIIGVLSGVMLRVMNISDINKKARDSQRVADIRRIQTALELSYVDTRVYPTAPTLLSITSTDTLSTFLESGSYISDVPVDPMRATNTTYAYRYVSSGPTAGKIYSIYYAIESEPTTNRCGVNPYSGLSVGCDLVRNPL